MNIVSHGKLLDRPLKRPEATEGSVGYELGRFFQLDDEHCLFTASMDEQGGGDRCVGNDGFIIKSLDDIKPENAFAINRPLPEYKLRSGKGTAFLAVFPCDGAFVPLGATLSDGRAHPAAGTGFLITAGMTFQEHASIDKDTEIVFEVVQLSWDGKDLKMKDRVFIHSLLGREISGMGISYYCPKDEGFLVPFTSAEGTLVFEFQYDGSQWKAVDCGEAFVASPINTVKSSDEGIDGAYIASCKETEPSVQPCENGFVVYTRGSDGRGRVYTSTDGLNYTLKLERKNNAVPQVLNRDLSGRLYLATNPNLDWLRNPLVVYPLDENLNCGSAITIHDQDGVRDDKGDSIPFVDHALGTDVVLEGKKRHFLTYRVCDLKERTFHKGQEEMAARVHKDGGPTERASYGGLYMVEIVPD